MVYKILNIFFYVFHILLILFNLFGWLVQPVRKLNLATLVLTAFSWFILGIWYGFGYCFLTDWHWQVREQLGYAVSTNSYIQFLLIEMFGSSPSVTVVDTATALFFFGALAASLFVNYRDFKRGR